MITLASEAAAITSPLGATLKSTTGRQIEPRQLVLGRALQEGLQMLGEDLAGHDAGGPLSPGVVDGGIPGQTFLRDLAVG